MSKRCKHEDWNDWQWSRLSDDGGRVLCFYRYCVRCGETLPLGPASDNEATAVEVRAAEIAADWERFCEGWHGFTSLGSVSPEMEHLSILEQGIVNVPTSELNKQDLRDYLAGYLANEIATHTSGTEEG